MHQVGLIGFGAFGHAITGWLSDVCSFAVYDKAVPTGTLEAALSQPIIILNIPAQNLEDFLVTHQALLPTNALYIDVCSVKVKPVRIMQRCIPAGAEIIGSHPLFGPQTAASGVGGHKIMVTPVRCSAETFERFKQFLSRLELQIIETTPETHDRAMAYAQGLSHYIGRITKEMNIPETELATQAYTDLLDMKRIQGNDSDDLYSSIVHTNPYTLDILQKFATAQTKVDEQFAIGQPSDSSSG